MKKNLKVLLTMAVVMFAMAIAVQAKAAEAKKSTGVVVSDAGVQAKEAFAKGDFGITEYYPSTRRIRYGAIATEDMNTITFEVYKNNKRVLNNTVSASHYYVTYTDFYTLANNAIYKLRVKGDTTDWSSYKYFSVPKCKLTSRSNQKGFKIKTPKNKKIKNYRIEVGKSLDGSYKKAKSIKANKKRTTRITKKYKKGSTNYVKVTPYIKVGGKTVKSQLSVVYSIYVFK